jgi:hypothetical protein
VAVLHTVQFMAAVSALAVLPCLLLLLMSSGDLFDGVGRFLRRRRRRRIDRAGLSRREWRRLARLDRCFDRHLAAEVSPASPPFETVAADLRRLHSQRAGIALRSVVWFTAIERAYDERLRLACQRLGIDEHLDELTGVDREIERVRLEGELEAAGLTLHGAEAASS